MRSISTQGSAEARAQLSAGIGGIVGALVALFAFTSAGIRLAGEGSIGTVAAITAAVLGIPTFSIVYTLTNRTQARWRLRGRTRRLLDGLGVTVAGCATAAMLILSVYTVLSLAFLFLVVDRIAATVLVAVTVAVSNYALARLANALDTDRLANLLGMFFAAGVIASTLTAENPEWWEWNFSALGMGTALSARAFNLTVIIAGLVLVTLADYLTIDLYSSHRRGTGKVNGVVVVRTILIIVGIGIVGLGLVPVNVNQIAHNVFAIAAMLGFGALFLVTPMVIRGLPRTFAAMSVIFAAALVFVALLWVPIGYFNLTAAELLAVLMLLAWLVLLARGAAASSDAQAAPATDAGAAGTSRTAAGDRPAGAATARSGARSAKRPGRVGVVARSGGQAAGDAPGRRDASVPSPALHRPGRGIGTGIAALGALAVGIVVGAGLTGGDANARRRGR